MAYDAFLKLDGIDGEVNDQTHAAWIELQSFSWGASNSGSQASGGGGGAGKVSFQDLHCEGPTSKASPNIMLACATGKHIASAMLSLKQDTPGATNALEFMKIKLTDVLISGYQNGGAEQGEDRPLDGFSLNFVKIDFLYTVASTGETVEAAFDTGALR
ncbi:MAG TPA: type VI secretion system tube protein Hcp [Gaiellaceae bacterium]|nr:type VI secretion system tube protein Hcp [Gaiellaceae bacterium]